MLSRNLSPRISLIMLILVLVPVETVLVFISQPTQKVSKNLPILATLLLIATIQFPYRQMQRLVFSGFIFGFCLAPSNYWLESLALNDKEPQTITVARSWLILLFAFTLILVKSIRALQYEKDFKNRVWMSEKIYE